MTNVVERDLQQVKCKAEDHGYRRSWKRKSQLVCSDSELPSTIKELLSGVLVTLPTSARFSHWQFEVPVQGQHQQGG